MSIFHENFNGVARYHVNGNRNIYNICMPGPEEFVNLLCLLVQSSNYFAISSIQFSSLDTSLSGNFAQFSSGSRGQMSSLGSVQSTQFGRALHMLKKAQPCATEAPFSGRRVPLLVKGAPYQLRERQSPVPLSSLFLTFLFHLSTWRWVVIATSALWIIQMYVFVYVYAIIGAKAPLGARKTSLLVGGAPCLLTKALSWAKKGAFSAKRVP